MRSTESRGGAIRCRTTWSSQRRLLPVRQGRKAMREAGIDGLLHLVEPGKGRSASDQHHFRRPRLERHRRVVEGGGGEPDDRDPATREGGEVDVVRAVPDPIAQERGERLRHPRRRLPLAPGREDHPTGVDRLRPARPDEPHPDTVRLRLERGHLDLVLDPRAGHPAVPVEIVRPDRRRDPAEPVPVAPPGLPPRPEGEPRHPQHRPGEVLRRSQGLHAGVGPPRTLPPLEAPVHLPEVRDPDPAQCERRRKPAHAAAHDRDVDHPPPVRSRAGRDPVRRRVVQPLEVPREARFQPRQSVNSAHRHVPDDQSTAPPTERRTDPHVITQDRMNPPYRSWPPGRRCQRIASRLELSDERNCGPRAVPTGERDRGNPGGSPANGAAHLRRPAPATAFAADLPNVPKDRRTDDLRLLPCR